MLNRSSPFLSILENFRHSLNLASAYFAVSFFLSWLLLLFLSSCHDSSLLLNPLLSFFFDSFTQYLSLHHFISFLDFFFLILEISVSSSCFCHHNPSLIYFLILALSMSFFFNFNCDASVYVFGDVSNMGHPVLTLFVLQSSNPTSPFSKISSLWDFDFNRRVRNPWFSGKIMERDDILYIDGVEKNVWKQNLTYLFLFENVCFGNCYVNVKREWVMRDSKRSQLIKYIVRVEGEAMDVEDCTSQWSHHTPKLLQLVRREGRVSTLSIEPKEKKKGETQWNRAFWKKLWRGEIWRH